MGTLFTKIINREIPAEIVHENDDFIAFLDINPLKKGHTLIVPKLEIDYIFDLPDELYQKLFLFAKEVSFAIKKSYPCLKVGVAVIGLEVPHVHIHLVPMDKISDLNFSNPKLTLSTEELRESADKIKQNI